LIQRKAYLADADSCSDSSGLDLVKLFITERILHSAVQSFLHFLGQVIKSQI
jgi:hypothetical protein